MRRTAFLGVVSAMALAACQTGPAETQISAAPASQTPAPEAVAASLIAEVRTGPRVNQWGGVIPDAKPTVPVDDGGLGEVR